MKNFCKMCFTLFALFSLGYAHSSNAVSSDHAFVKCEKIYVQPNQLEITSEGIFFQLDDSWIMTDAIHCDTAGLFISSISNEWTWTWTCPNCGHENSALNRSCKKCGYKPKH